MSTRLKGLLVALGIHSVVGAGTGLWLWYTMSEVSSDRLGQVTVRISPDGEHVLRYHQETQRLRVARVSSGRQVAEASLMARQVEWCPDSSTLAAIANDEPGPREFRLLFIGRDGARRQTGPPGFRFAFDPDGDAYVAGHGQYMTPGDGNTVAHWSRREAAASRAFAPFALDVSGGSFSGLAVPGDGTLLAASVWRYNDSDALVLWNLRENRKVFETRDEGGPVAFTPDGRTLVAVQSCSAMVQVRTFDALKGSCLQTSPRSGGSCEAVAVSSDGSRIALARAGYPEKGHDVEIYDTRTLEKVCGIVLPGERYGCDVRFVRDELLMAGESGHVWRWRPGDAGPTLVGARSLAPDDWRWRYVIGGLTVYGLLWIPMVLMRRCIPACPERPSLLGGKLATAVLVLEIVRVSFALASPMVLISAANALLVLGHIVLATASMVWLIELVVLRVPVSKRWLFAAALVVAIAAYVDARITFEAIASV